MCFPRCIVVLVLSAAFLRAADFSLEIEAGVKTLAAEPDAARRGELVNDWVNSLPLEHAPSVLSVLAPQGARPNELAEEIAGQFARRLAAKDFNAASAWTESMPEGPLRREALSQLLLVTTGLDPAIGVRWARREIEAGGDGELALRVAGEVIGTDPAGAAGLAAALPTGAVQGDIVRRAAMEWAVREPQAARKWAEHLQDAPAREKAFSGMALVLAESDPASARSFIERALPAGRERDNTLAGLAQRWTQRDPSAAAAWAEKLSPGPGRKAVFENVIRIWAERSADDMAAWLGRRPPGAERDSHARLVMECLLPARPDLAASAAVTIGNPLLRKTCVKQAAAAWLAVNEQAATAWVRQAGLPDDLQALLMAKISSQ